MTKGAEFVNLMFDELKRSQTLYPPLTTLHEALGVIREEYMEFEKEVFKKPEHRDTQKTLTELKQLAAMCWRTAEDLELLPNLPLGNVEKKL